MHGKTSYFSCSPWSYCYSLFSADLTDQNTLFCPLKFHATDIVPLLDGLFSYVQLYYETETQAHEKSAR